MDFLPLLFIMIFILAPIALIFVARNEEKKRQARIADESELLTPRQFTLIDLYSRSYYDGDATQILLFPLIEDDETHERFVFEVSRDTYFWKEYDEQKKPVYLDYHSFKKPTFSKNQEIVYNVAGGKYKKREEYGTVEVTDNDVIFHYYGEEEKGILSKLASNHRKKEYKHFNDNHDFDDINNAKIIDCFINFDRF